jgi:hypothetical protein
VAGQSNDDTSRNEHLSFPLAGRRHLERHAGHLDGQGLTIKAQNRIGLVGWLAELRRCFQQASELGAFDGERTGHASSPHSISRSGEPLS